MSPPPKEYPARYVGNRWRTRKLTDDQVIEARKDICSVSCLQLAQRYGVAWKTMNAAVKGLTFKHLNLDHPPQL